MRSGIIVAIFVAVVVVIGGIIWNNSQNEQARLEQEQIEQTAHDDENRAREEQAARDAEEAEAQGAMDTATEDGAAVTQDDPIVVGDEITEDTIVVDAANDEPTILDPDETTNTAVIVEETTVEEPHATDDNRDETATTEAAQAPNQTDVNTDAAPPTSAEELLTPANFDRDKILALIDDSDDLSADQRSALGALIRGASENPSMVDSAIASTRATLELPPLN